MNLVQCEINNERPIYVQGGNMIEWEYAMMPVRRPDPYTQTVADLNDLGEQGWELCQLKDDVRKDGKITGIFKRVKQ